MLVIGCPIKSRAWSVPYWHAAIEAQGLDVKVVCLVSPSDDGTEDRLAERSVEMILDEEPSRGTQEIDGHQWAPHRFDYMARIRNRLLEAVIDMGADYFFSLDSDIVLPEGALQTLLDYMTADHPGIVSPAVNMAIHARAMNNMHWQDPHRPGMVDRSPNPPDGTADVVMAAMLLDRRGMECRWAHHIAGEDIGFCIDAVAKGVPRWWLSRVRCTHLMTRC